MFCWNLTQSEAPNKVMMGIKPIGVSPIPDGAALGC